MGIIQPVVKDTGFHAMGKGYFTGGIFSHLDQCLSSGFIGWFLRDNVDNTG